jgi:hypothetical protein
MRVMVLGAGFIGTRYLLRAHPKPAMRLRTYVRPGRAGALRNGILVRPSRRGSPSWRLRALTGEVVAASRGRPLAHQ